MKFPFFSKKVHKEFYLGVFLKEDQGIIMIFLKENGRLELVDREKFNFTNGWENLTNDVDEALYKLEKNLDLELKNTIIFVYSHLVDEKIGDIKPVYLQKIKQLTKALELKPMGYIECYEAISFYLQKGDQNSLTAILIELDKKQVGLFSYMGGKLESKNILVRTDNIIEDLTEGFAEIKKKSMLPPRIILYDSGNLDDTATKILSHHWKNEFFVQIPKVDILSEDEVINGLMGIFGEQIKNTVPLVKIEESPNKETFGFVINKDVAENSPIEMEDRLPEIAWKNKVSDFFSKFMGIFRKKNNQNKVKFNLSGKIFAIIGIVIIALGLFINEYFFHNAQLTLYLPTQELSKNAGIEMEYRVSSSSANFTESINTTGKQDIGEKARGTVTVHNFDDKEKIFSKGTTLKASSIDFLLDTDVKVASSTLTADGSAKLPGKTNGTITASQIGPEANLTKGQRFTFDGLSSATFFAVNDSVLSGGSKKQIQTVAKKDQDSLRTTVINKAKKQIPEIKTSTNETIASTLSEVEINKENFSKEVGEESNKLTLQATTNTVQYLYDKKLFVNKILTLLEEDIQDNYELEKENISFTVSKIKKDETFLDIDTKVKGKAIIKISIDEIKKSLVGKNDSEIKQILKDRFKIEGYNLAINEPLQIFKNYLPFFPKNIILKKSSL